MTPDLFVRPGSYPACPRGDVCSQGDNCQCDPAAKRIKSVESDHPWLWLVYVVVGVLSCVAWKWFPQPFGG